MNFFFRYNYTYVNLEYGVKAHVVRSVLFIFPCEPEITGEATSKFQTFILTFFQFQRLFFYYKFGKTNKRISVAGYLVRTYQISQQSLNIREMWKLGRRDVLPPPTMGKRVG